MEVQDSQMEVLHKDEEDLEDRVVLLLRRNLRVLEVLSGQDLSFLFFFLLWKFWNLMMKGQY